MLLRRLIALADLGVERQEIVEHTQPEQAERQQIQKARAPFAQIEPMQAEHAPRNVSSSQATE